MFWERGRPAVPGGTGDLWYVHAIECLWVASEVEFEWWCRR